jgi:hypothetical protein
MAGSGSASDRGFGVRDGKTWRLGVQSDVAWIAQHTTIGLTIDAAIPLVFDAYATVVVAEDDAARRNQDRALVSLLSERSGEIPWWLGYLDTGTEDVVFPDAPMVTLYSDWNYVLVEAGPEQAASWREDRSSSFGALPDLMFAADRSWLVSRLWDDDWRCLGGPADLLDGCRRDPHLRARPVSPGENATPPGHTAA